MSLLARIERARAARDVRLWQAVSVRTAYAFGEWPPRRWCHEPDTYRNGPCLRQPGHCGNHSAVGCAEGC